MAAKMTPELIEKINELYLQIGTYVGVSRELGGSPSPATIKKYIVPGYTSKAAREATIIRFNDEMLEKEFKVEPFLRENWAELTVLTDEERAAMPKFWEELSV